MELFRTFYSIFNNQRRSYFQTKIKYLTNYSPNNLRFYEEAFTHKAKTSKNSDINFERLEFLGDAVLNTIITKYLFEVKPGCTEGELTKLRSKIVRRSQLNELGKSLNLIHYIVNFENQNLGNNIYGNLFESLIGAIFLDHGYERCEEFLVETINEHLDIEELENTISSYKSFIHEWCQKKKIKLEYDTRQEENAEDMIIFVSCLKIDNQEVVKGRAKSKKSAEELASKRAYYALQKDIEKS